MRFSLLVLISGLLSLLGVPRAEAEARIPRWVCSSLTKRPTLNFDVEKFTSAREDWVFRVAAGGDLPSLEKVFAESDGPEEAIAYLEAVSDASGSDLFRVGELLEKDPKRATAFLEKLTQTLEKGRLFTDRRTVSLVAELYALANTGKRNAFLRWLPRSASSTLEARVVSALERDSLEEAFRKLGFFREPGRYRRFRNWIGTHEYVVEVPLAIGMNAFSLHFLARAMPPGRLNLLRWKTIPEAWKIAYRMGGLAAVKPLFRKEFKFLPEVDLAWRIFSYAASVASTGVLVYYVLTEPKAAVGKVKWGIYLVRHSLTDPSAHGLQQYFDLYFRCNEARQQTLDEWKEIYVELKGIELTPESDPVEWKRVESNVLWAPCESLRVHFEK